MLAASTPEEGVPGVPPEQGVDRGQLANQEDVDVTMFPGGDMLWAELLSEVRRIKCCPFSWECAP